MGQQTDEIMGMVDAMVDCVRGFPSSRLDRGGPALWAPIAIADARERLQVRLLALESRAYPELAISHGPGTSDFLSIHTDFDGNDLG